MSAGFGAYIHWPYCTRLCPYCDFNVRLARGADGEALVRALVADMAGHAARIGARPLDTIFFGGGTPSLMAPGDIEKLIAAADRIFGLSADAEITVEANPDERARFSDFAAAGINRFSIGVQALRDDALKALGRTHDAQGARAAVEAATKTGKRVSIDMIYARAGQSLAEWSGELREALALPAEHFSLYELTIKPDTAFARAVARGTLAPPDDDQAAAFYEQTQSLCDAAGFPAYEISNHARSEAARARHNLIYWRGGEWLGLGPGAHGRVSVEGKRWASTAEKSPGDYIAAVSARGIGWESAEALSDEAVAEEALIMGLRSAEGAPRDLPGLDIEKARALARDGFVIVTPDRIALTAAGRLLADRIALELSA